MFDTKEKTKTDRLSWLRSNLERRILSAIALITGATLPLASDKISAFTVNTFPELAMSWQNLIHQVPRLAQNLAQLAIENPLEIFTTVVILGPELLRKTAESEFALDPSAQQLLRLSLWERGKEKQNEYDKRIEFLIDMIEYRLKNRLPGVQNSNLREIVAMMDDADSEISKRLKTSGASDSFRRIVDDIEIESVDDVEQILQLLNYKASKNRSRFSTAQLVKLAFASGVLAVNLLAPVAQKNIIDHPQPPPPIEQLIISQNIPDTSQDEIPPEPEKNFDDSLYVTEYYSNSSGYEPGEKMATINIPFLGTDREMPIIQGGFFDGDNNDGVNVYNEDILNEYTKGYSHTIHINEDGALSFGHVGVTIIAGHNEGDGALFHTGAFNGLDDAWDEARKSGEELIFPITTDNVTYTYRIIGKIPISREEPSVTKDISNPNDYYIVLPNGENITLYQMKETYVGNNRITPWGDDKNSYVILQTCQDYPTLLSSNDQRKDYKETVDGYVAILESVSVIGDDGQKIEKPIPFQDYRTE